MAVEDVVVGSFGNRCVSGRADPSIRARIRVVRKALRFQVCRGREDAFDSLRVCQSRSVRSGGVWLWREKLPISKILSSHTTEVVLVGGALSCVNVGGRGDYQPTKQSSQTDLRPVSTLSSSRTTPR
jgi:hypothetical protein